MEVLAFSDLHGNKKQALRLIKQGEEADVLVCAGDISMMGTDLEKVISWFKDTGKKLVLVHGNHESEKQIEKIIQNYDFVVNVHFRIQRIGNFIFVGYGGGGFSRDDKDLEKFAEFVKKNIKEDDKILFVSHAPPYGTKVDKIDHLGFRGCESVNYFIKKIKPKYCICGHLHETEGKKDKVDRTFVINPGMKGIIVKL